MRGTPGFMAPELASPSIAVEDVHKCDVFSLGVTILRARKLKQSNFELSPEPHGQQASAKLIDLLKSMTNPDPKSRCSIEAIRSSDWFRFHQLDPSTNIQARAEIESKVRYVQSLTKIKIPMPDKAAANVSASNY